MWRSINSQAAVQFDFNRTTMVCQKCTKVSDSTLALILADTYHLFCSQKLSKVAAPDPFAPSSSSRKVGENKLLTGRNAGGGSGGPSKKYQPYQKKCKDCKSSVTQNSAKYCHGESYSSFGCGEARGLTRVLV